jgi:hypothetical protein
MERYEISGGRLELLAASLKYVTGIRVYEPNDSHWTRYEPVKVFPNPNKDEVYIINLGNLNSNQEGDVQFLMHQM